MNTRTRLLHLLPLLAFSTATHGAITEPQKIAIPTSTSNSSQVATSTPNRISLSGVPQEPSSLQQGADGFKLKDYPINDLFLYLARQAGKQYFSNPALTMTVSGQMKDGKPVQRMQEIAFQYGVTLYQKGDTIYAINAASLTDLPKKQGTFPLKYLRPDGKRIKELIQPFLTPSVGTVDFEDKTNTVVVHDNDPAITRVSDFLARVDISQRQVTVQVRVFRVNADAANRVGVDWGATLGEKGLNLQATATSTMTEIFGAVTGTSIVQNLVNTGFASSLLSDIANVGTTSTYTGTGESTRSNNYAAENTRSLTMSPTTITAVLRALYSAGNVKEDSNPTIVTEDNETATIENINKIPIVTSTLQAATAGAAAVTTSVVRYQIDPADNFDVGVKLKIRPTILPGNKLRLVIDPEVGSIRGWVNAASGDPALPNRYPDVILSRTKNIATIPNGYTLIFGGFSRTTVTQEGTKVPILGDIPGVNFFFKSRGNMKVRENLIFMITATASDLSNSKVLVPESERIRRSYVENVDAYRADDNKVNLSPDANLLGTLQDELTPFAKRNVDDNPISPTNPRNEPPQPITTAQEREQLNAMPPPNKRKSKPWEFLIPPQSQE